MNGLINLFVDLFIYLFIHVLNKQGYIFSTQLTGGRTTFIAPSRLIVGTDRHAQTSDKLMGVTSVASVRQADQN